MIEAKVKVLTMHTFRGVTGEVTDLRQRQASVASAFVGYGTSFGMFGGVSKGTISSVWDFWLIDQDDNRPTPIADVPISLPLREHDIVSLIFAETRHHKQLVAGRNETTGHALDFYRLYMGSGIMRLFRTRFGNVSEWTERTAIKRVVRCASEPGTVDGLERIATSTRRTMTMPGAGPRN